MADATPTPFRTETIDGTAFNIFQAEDAQLVGPLVVPSTTLNRNADGGAYVDPDGSGDQTITWVVDVTEAGVYGLDIIYALGPNRAARPMTLSIDGVVVETLSFTANSNGSWSLWGPLSTAITLAAGQRLITLTAPNAVAPNIDAMRLTEAPRPGDDPPEDDDPPVDDEPPAPGDGVEIVDGVEFVVYEAEKALLQGPIVIPAAQSDRGASGGSFVDYKGRGNQSIVWTVEVDEAGTYRLDIIYQLVVGKAARPMTLSVDGAPGLVLPFVPNAADESGWGPQTVEIALGAGSHTLSLTAPNAVGPDIDYLRITAEPLDAERFAAINGEGRIELEATDGTAAVLAPDSAAFRFTVAEEGLYALEFAANGPGAATALDLRLNGEALDSVAFPGVGEAGETRLQTRLRAGVEYTLAVASDAAGAGDLDYLDVRRTAPSAAELEVRAVGLDGAMFEDRMAFSFMVRPVVIGQESLGPLTNKDTGFFEISNTGTEPLVIEDAVIDGPFVLTGPSSLDGLTIDPGETLRVGVRFDPGIWADRPTSRNWKEIDAQQKPASGSLTLLTNADDAPRQVMSFGAHWQLVNESGMEATVNEVWEVLGFGNRIDGLPNTNNGARSSFSRTGAAVALDDTEVISPYWRVADGYDSVTFINIANYSGFGSKSFHIHAPGNRNAAVEVIRSDAPDSQRVLPTVGDALAQGSVAASAIPASWAGDGVFGLRADGYSSDPRLNNFGDQVVNGVQQGLFVKVFQALDANGVAIPDTWLIIQDVNGLNADYNDSMFLMRGAAPVGSAAQIVAPEALAFTDDEAPEVPGLTRSLVVSNEGIAALVITDIAIEGADAADFRIVSGLAEGQSIAAGGSTTVVVQFTGSPARNADATLVIASNDGPVRVALSAPPDLVLRAGDDLFATTADAALEVPAAEGVLVNDRLGAGDGTVVAVNGIAPGADGTVTVAGSAGGLFTLSADGALRFDPNGDFSALGDNEAVATEISYAIRGADGLIDSAWVTVQVSASGNTPVQPSGLLAEYFTIPQVSSLSAINFGATPAFAERVSSIDYASTRGAFWAGGPNDDFAVRFTGSFETPGSGSYTFNLASDDGAALYIDGRLVIDHDGLHAASTKSATVTLGQGTHAIELRYFERSLDAALRLDWQGPGLAGTQPMVFGPQQAAPTGLVEFYALPAAVNDLDQVSFGGKPTAIGAVDGVSIDAGTGPLWTGGPVDNVAARFTGAVTVAAAGSYTFFLTSDDGSELWVDGVRVIDNDRIQPSTLKTGTITLGAGVHAVEVRYYEAGGFASVDLDWQGPDTGGQRDGLSFAPAPGMVAQAPRAADVTSAFSLIEGAEDVALAIPTTDAAGDGLTISAIDQPTSGVVQVAANGVVTYTPDAGFNGVDSFRWIGIDAGGETTSGLVNLRVRAAHQQPQSVLDPDIAPEILPSGDALILRQVAELPRGVNGAAPRMDTVLAHDGAIYVGVEGTVNGESAIYRLTPDGAGGYDTALWFDVGAAVTSATGRQVNNTNAQHGGLRGLAFHPDFETNGKLYTAIMEGRPSNPASPAFTYLSDVPNPVVADSVLVEWTLDPTTGAVDPASYREVFRVGMPVYDHPIKQIAFNPHAREGDADYGLLYIGHGDGSVQSATAGGGQNNDALGKILRVDPLQNGADSYRVPPDNPFVGDPAMLDEVYALGFRNPHQLAFHRDDDGVVRLISTEVGRDNFDEINIVVAGGNYGWSGREGPLLHLQDGGGVLNGLLPLPDNEADFGFIFPAAFYGHEGAEGTGFTGQALAGGFVLDNGGELDGRFIFGDFGNSGRIFSTRIEDMLAADTTVTSGEVVADALSWAETGAVQLYLDHDRDAATLPIAYDTFSSLIGQSRSDFRFGRGLDGELLIINKRDGFVYVAANTLPTDHANFQSTDFTDGLFA